MDMGLTGKVVLITGAGRNIGRATAEAFAAEGSRLVLATRRSGDLLEQTADACRAAGAEVRDRPLRCRRREPGEGHGANGGARLR